eukprot:TRINITY_DN1_c0_g1_i1.p1 TRINITY_DN1_c0_g1~~TRINITY_DN1_c0_g1_i1.p1  ORF type:complete len:557 (+),score=201.67 TRINITY_DN1_c0_g1_i1:55-1671(+)
MVFSLDVGSDLYGTKCNVTLEFPNRPTVAELTAATESNFDVKSRAQRPAGYPDTPFKIETFQLFDDTLLRWVDLYNEQQLRHGVQLWCFQPESIWHSDAQGVIPTAQRAPVTWTTPLGSPRRARIAADAGVPPTLSEKLRSVFFQIDGQNKGYLLFNDLENAFRRCDMAFTQGTAGDLFTLADQNRSQHITYDEWVNFAVKCPSVVDALFFKMRDMGHDAPHSPPGYDAQKQRQQELTNMYRDNWQNTPAKMQAEQDFKLAQEAERRRAQADQALREHQDALEKAQQAAQQHAAQHAQARQYASDQTRSMDDAQNALRQAESDAAAASAQEAAARAAMDQAKMKRAAAEQALRQAQEYQQAAQQQADSEAAAQYAAEQHAAQQQAAKDHAAHLAQLAAQEHQQALEAERAAQEAYAAQRAAQQAQQDAQQAAHQLQQAEAAAQAAYSAQRAREREFSQTPPPPTPAYYHQPAQPAHQPAPAYHSPNTHDPRIEYEAAKRRADELRRQKEDAEREEREAWNKLYYSPASPHYLSHSPHH